MPERLFSVEEANALIPRLEIIMQRLQRHAAALRESLEDLARTTGHTPDAISTAQLVHLRPELRPVVQDMQHLFGEIEACGGQFKGLELGLVDFPSELDGQIVLLCWQYAEPEIAFYHTGDAGFAGRTPFPASARRARFLQ